MSTVTTVTLLVTDVVGSTELLDRLGDDAADDLRRAHFAQLRETFAPHGGREVKNVGDGLIVAFPSALSAATSAIAMQKRVARHSRDDPARRMEIRVGISAGEAYVDEGDYFGTPMVVASRLCDRAEAGQILVADVARALIGRRGDLEFESLGSLALKGFADPVGTFALSWKDAEVPALDPPSPVADPAGPESQVPLPALVATTAQGAFVGRDEELERLMGAFGAAAEGSSQVALLAGEPGIGKTRLSSEVARRAHEAGAIVLYGRNDEESLVPFQPFAEALEHYALHADPATLRAQAAEDGMRLRHLVPRLAAPGAQPGTEADGDRHLMFTSLVAFLGRVAADRPLVLILDDLHWADPGTVLMLKHVARSAEGARLLILGTYRAAELDDNDPLAQAVLTMRRERGFAHVHLTGLSEEDVAGLITSWAHQPAPADFVRTLWSETEGHPFFVQEVLRHLLESGALHGEDGRLISRLEVGRVGIPQGVREIVDRRVARLDDRTRRLLSIAAVIGRDFRSDVLARVAEDPLDDVLEDLEQAVAAGLVDEAGGVEDFRFAHALIRASLYDALSQARRARLHVRIGEALEELSDGETLPELAHHFFQAAAGSDMVEKAISYALGAGAHAAEQLAYEEAVTQFDRAVRALRLQGDETSRMCSALISLGENRWAVGEYFAARDDFKAAAELADRLGLAEHLARAALGFAGQTGFEIGFENQAMVRLLERAEQMQGGERTALHARVLGRLCEALTAMKQRERALEIGLEAIAIAREVGDDAVLAQVLTHSVWPRWRPDNIEERLELAGEIIERGRRAQAREVQWTGYVLRISTNLEKGDIDAAEREFEVCVALAEELHQPFYDWCAEVMRASLCLLRGDLPEAERLAWSSLERARANNNRSGAQLFGVQILHLRQFQRRLPEMHAATKDMADYFTAIPTLRSGLAMLYAETGRLDDARTELEQLAAGDFARFPVDAFWTTGMVLLSDVVMAVGDEARAARAYELLAPHEDVFVVSGVFAGPIGFIGRTLGALSLMLGEPERAVAHLERAVAASDRIGAVPAMLRAQIDLARALRARGGPGDAGSASRLLAEAVQRAGALGLENLRHDAAEEAGASAEEAAQRPRARKVRAAISTRGRAGLAKLVGDADDDELERRFGSPLTQRALLTGMAQSFQPAAAMGFQGEVALVLLHDSGDGRRVETWWTIDIRATKAVVRHRRAADPVATLRAGVADFIRIFSGLTNPVEQWFEGRIDVAGEVIVAARLIEIFGGVSPEDLPAEVA